MMEYSFIGNSFIAKKNIQKYALLNTQPPQYLADILTKIIEMEVSWNEGPPVIIHFKSF